ncbi:MAG TPA: DedA family protein [Egibacteraceae bacterium]|nr:DedA family protein [Egibacteraceae bacterium]
MNAAREPLAALLAAVEAGGGAAIALVMFVENVFPPIPSEAVLPLAGFAVHSGRMPFALAVTAATVGSVAGALTLHTVGRFGGRPLLERYRWLLRLDEAQLDRADAWFDRYGPALVFWARMVPLARSVVSVPAGMAEMPIGRFLALTTAGSLVWNGMLISAGMLFGTRWAQVGEIVGASSKLVLMVAAAAAAAGVFGIGYRRRRAARRRQRQETAG